MFAWTDTLTSQQAFPIHDRDEMKFLYHLGVDDQCTDLKPPAPDNDIAKVDIDARIKLPGRNNTAVSMDHLLHVHHKTEEMYTAGKISPQQVENSLLPYLTWSMIVTAILKAASPMPRAI